MSRNPLSRSARVGRPSRPDVTNFRPRVESLESRTVPASLISVAPDNVTMPDAPVVVLGTSDDGNFVLVQSTATNLVTGQVDVPGTNDLFYFDRLAGTRQLITAYDPPTGSTVLAGTKAVGAEISVPGQAHNAVISADGKRVAFLSGASAQLFNSSLAAVIDGGGNDLYIWDSTTAKSTLTSVDKNGFALGSYSGVANPSISLDGTSVGFVSTANMSFAFATKYVDNTTSPDLFRADAGKTPHPVTYYETKDINGNLIYPAYGNVSVDPLGRFMSGDGITFVIVGGVPSFGGKGGATTAPSDVIRLTFAGVGLDPNQPVTNTLTSTGGFGASGVSSGNAMLARDRSDQVIFTAIVPAGVALVPGYINQNSDSYDVYRAAFTGTGITRELVSIAAGTTGTGMNGTLDAAAGGIQVTPDGRNVLFTTTASNLVGGIFDRNKALDVYQRNITTNTTSAISVTSTNSNRTGLGESRFPTMTTDGLVIAFQSAATDLTLTADDNGATDVFVRDLGLKTTVMASVIPGSFRAGDGQSFGPVIGGTFRSGRLYFSSQSSDLDRLFTVPATNKNARLYESQTPILVTNVPRSVAYSGGSGGFASVGKLDLDGRITASSKFQPFPGFGGDIRVASGDVTGDGVFDLIVGAGPGGGPRVILIDGFNGRTLRDFFAYESKFTGGVYVAASDINGDGFAEIIIGAGEGGGPRVKIYDGLTSVLLVDEFAYEPKSRTGVRVAGGDFNGDGTNDLIVAAGIGGGPRVRVFDGKVLPTLSVQADFFAFESSQRGGAYVSAGDFDGDGKADIAVGAGPEGGPRVRVFNADNVVIQDPNKRLVLADFYAFDSDNRDGVRVTLRDIDGDKTADLVAATGRGVPRIKTFAGASSSAPYAPNALQEFSPFNETFGVNGAWVG